MDLLARAFRDSRSAAITLGLGTVAVTHTAMLLHLLPPDWAEHQQANHALLNLAAAAAIAYGARTFG